MKAFPYPFVLIIPHSDVVPLVDSVNVGDVVRVVSRTNEYVIANYFDYSSTNIGLFGIAKSPLQMCRKYQ